MSTIETFFGYPESTITLTEDEVMVISNMLTENIDAYDGVGYVPKLGLIWIMDTLEPQWEGRWALPQRDLTLLNIQWEAVDEMLSAIGHGVILEVGEEGWTRAEPIS